MIVDVEMPHQGLTLTEAMLLHWLKAPGDAVAKDEGLFEIETEKAVQEMPSPVAGTVLALLVAEGDWVPLGDIVAKIGTEATDRLEEIIAQPTLTPIPLAEMQDHDEPVSDATPMRSASIASSPRAQRAAMKYQLDLSAVTATGGDGRHIIERDVLAMVSRSALDAPPATSNARRITAERTSASFREAPHFYLTREVVVDRLLEFRRQLLDEMGDLAPARVSLTDCLLKAMAMALSNHPTLNHQWQDGGLTALTTTEIGLAIDTPHGLLVPVLRELATASLVDIAVHRQALVQRAQAGVLHSAEMAGGSMTLSNLGTLGIDQFQAIINPPQSAILAVGAVKPRPVALDGELRIADTLFLTLAVDHRVADGAEGARFLQAVIDLLLHPLRMCCASTQRGER